MNEEKKTQGWGGRGGNKKRETELEKNEYSQRERETHRTNTISPFARRTDDNDDDDDDENNILYTLVHARMRKKAE